MSVKDLYDSFGGNYQQAIQTMMMDAFITKMLTKFLDKNAYQDILDSYQKNDLHGVFEAAHSLKGVCGNLALTPIYEKASVVCEATRNLKEGEVVDVSKQIEDLKETYQRVSSALRGFLG